MACLCGFMRSATALPRSNLPNPNLIVQIRWRKPRWVPVAKTKMFYVRKPTPISDEERKEFMNLHNHYKTHMKAIRKFVMKWQHDIKTEDESLEEVERAAAEEHQRVLEINRKWNEEVALQRQKRQEEEELQREILRDNLRQQRAEKEHQIKEEAARYIQHEMEQAKTFVTEETLDDEIEKLLNTRKDYNFAVDSDGNKISNEKEQQQHVRETG